MPKTQQILNQGESPSVVLRGFVGLSLKLDLVNRPNNSFQQLDNFDLYIPGSIRKVLPFSKYNGPFGANLLNCIEYLAQPNNPQGGIRRVLAVGVDGNVYDLATPTPSVPYITTSALLGAPSTIPFILQYSGYYIPYNMRLWQANTTYALHDAVLVYGPDGNIYVFQMTTPGTSGQFEPIWPTSGTVADGTILAPAWSMVNGAITDDNTIVWTCRTAATHEYVNSEVHAIGDCIIDSNGNIQVVIAIYPPATSFSVGTPNWNTVVGGITQEHQVGIGNWAVTWMCLGQPAWKPKISYGFTTLTSYIIDSNGNIQQATTPGVSGSQPGQMTWTNEGIPTSDRFLANYLAIIVPGKQPVRLVEWQYDPTSTSEQPSVTVGPMGCSPPQMPIELEGQLVTPNLNGYAPASGRAYGWTLYNPQTLQESAISPFTGKTKITEEDAGNVTYTINGSILNPLPPGSKAIPYSSYQSYYLAIPISDLTPLVGQGYTTVRIYATKDGGTDFFLITTLYDNNGNQITNSDGSIPVAVLESLQAANSWNNYFPLPQGQVAVPAARIFEGSGPLNYAPDPVNLNSAAWVPGLGTSMYISSAAAPDGANAIAMDTGGADNTYKSIAIPVSPQEYYFQCYIDNTAGSNSVNAKIRMPNGTVLLTLTQPAGDAGTLSGTFTPTTAQRRVQIVVEVPSDVTISGTVLFADFVIQAGSSLSTVPTNYPTIDAGLIIPAPVPFANYPPPISAMAEVIDDALFLVDNADQTEIWYSQQGQFEKFGSESYVRTTVTKNADQILEIIKCFDRLLVCKGRSIEQITTYPPTEPVPVDPQHGVLARRASITWGSSILGLLTNGLGQTKLAASIIEDAINVGVSAELFGDDIKPLIDSINPATLRATNMGLQLPSPMIYNDEDLFLLAYQVGSNFNDNILGYFLGKAGRGFFRITALPANVITLKEIQLAPVGGVPAAPRAYALPPGDGDYFPIALCTDGNVYVMFNGTQNGSVIATAVTQPLPTPTDVPEEVWDTDKQFDYLYVEGQDITNFQVSFALDQDPTLPLSSVVFNNPIQLTKKTRIGLRGKSLTIKFTHAVATNNVPMLSLVKLAYGVIGARAY